MSAMGEAGPDRSFRLGSVVSLGELVEKAFRLTYAARSCTCLPLDQVNRCARQSSPVLVTTSACSRAAWSWGTDEGRVSGLGEVMLRVAREGLYLLLLVSAPVLLVTMVVGLLVSILQAATQVQEQTLSFVPKLVAAMVTLALLGPWIGTQLVRFTQSVLEAFPVVVR